MGNRKVKQLQQVKCHWTRLLLIWKDVCTFWTASSMEQLWVRSSSQQCSSGSHGSGLRQEEKGHCRWVLLSRQSQDRQWDSHHWGNCEEEMAREGPEGKIRTAIWLLLQMNGMKHGKFRTKTRLTPKRTLYLFQLSWFFRRWMTYYCTYQDKTYQI